MPHFAANLSMLYTELPFLDRFGAAAADGFDAVECLFPYDEMPAEMARRLSDHGLTQVLINAPPGDMAQGERGLAALPGRVGDFRRSIDRALALAQALRCRQVHVMAGLVLPGSDRDAMRDQYLANLAWAAAQAASADIDVLIEPLNPRDMPGYLLHRQEEAHAVVQQVGALNLKVQMDLYHCQIVEGDLSAKLRQYLPTGRVGHIQVAGVPERHEPDSGELQPSYLFALIDELGYRGCIGAEYRPRAGTRDGLGWAARYLKPRAIRGA